MGGGAAGSSAGDWEEGGRPLGGLGIGRRGGDRRFRMTTERLLNMPPNEHVVKVKAVWEVSLAFLKFLLLFFPCRKDKLLLLAYLLMGST